VLSRCCMQRVPAALIAAPLVLCLSAGAAAQAPAATESSEAIGALFGPDYFRGRTSEPNAEEILAWIPRILFLPLHLVSEYVLRVPIYALLEWAEREHVIEWIDFVLHPAPGVSWRPLLSLENSFVPIFGLHIDLRDVVGRNSRVSLAASTGGADYVSASLRARWGVGPVVLGLSESFTTRPDRPFFGLGPASGSVRTNYTLRQAAVSGFVRVGHDQHVGVQLTIGYSDENTSVGIAPSVDTQFDVRSLPGFGRLSLGVAAVDVSLDTRRAIEESSGVRLLGGTRFALDTVDPDRSFMSWYLDLEGAVEVSHPDRVLAARVLAVDTLSLGSGAVPFTHLAMLGSENHRGFVAGRFRGDSALLAEVRYRYPIAYFVDMQLVVSAGNVFGPRFDGFDVGALTGSFAVGLRTRRTGADPMDFTVGIGTSRFDDDDFSIDSVRVLFTTTRGL
jgi:hypothetical protein